MADRVLDVVLAQFGKVETGGEVLALAVNHDRFHVLGGGIEQCFQAEDGLVVQGVAFFGPAEPDEANFTPSSAWSESGSFGKDAGSFCDIGDLLKSSKIGSAPAPRSSMASPPHRVKVDAPRAT